MIRSIAKLYWSFSSKMSKSEKKIAVIGAGVMGLSAAYYLTEKNCSVDVFEKNKKIGGMAESFNFDGIEIEKYYHFHCTSDTDYFEMLEKLGLQKQLKWVSTKMGFWFNQKLQPWGNPIALLKFKGLSFSAKFRYGLHAFFCVKRNSWEDLDKLESTKWIKKWVGMEAWNKLWEKLFSQKFYEYSTQLSAAWIWSRIRRIGRSRYNIFKEKLGFLEGKSSALINGMANYILKNGNTITENQTITQVKKLNNGKYAIYSNDKLLGEYDRIISTIPLPYVADIFSGIIPPDAEQMFRNVINEGVVCVIVKLKKALTDNFWLNVNDDEMDIPGIIEYSNLNPCNGNHILYVPYYMPVTNSKFIESDEVYCQKIKKYFKKINPSLTDEDFEKIVVSRYTYAQPICGTEYLKTIPQLDVCGNHEILIADTSYYYPEDRGVSEGIKLSKSMVNIILNEF